MRKFSWPIKNLEKYFTAHQYMPKIFHEPHKNSPAFPPKYLMYSPLYYDDEYSYILKTS